MPDELLITLPRPQLSSVQTWIDQGELKMMKWKVDQTSLSFIGLSQKLNELSYQVQVEYTIYTLSNTYLHVPCPISTIAINKACCLAHLPMTPAPGRQQPVFRPHSHKLIQIMRRQHNRFNMNNQYYVKQQNQVGKLTILKDHQKRSVWEFWLMLKVARVSILFLYLLFG